MDTPQSHPNDAQALDNSSDEATTQTPAAASDDKTPDVEEVLDSDNPAGTPDDLDAVSPPHLPDSLTVVGLGGSAGSIPVLRNFFAKIPAESGMAFVVVIHLSPDFESTLPQLLQASTRMKVMQVNDKVKVEANHIYVIPPNVRLQMEDGNIFPEPLEQPRGKRVAIDLFFRALADAHGTSAVAIILSGADGDGSIGLKRLKERGGLTIAQEPDEAEHDSMPRSAIATGMVDWILPADQMPARLLTHQKNEKRLRLPAEAIALLDEDDQKVARRRDSERLERDDEAALRDILGILKARVGHDFSHYKRATVLRRIGRRLQVNSLPDLPSYLDFMRTHLGEAGALLNDLLISVTNYFRDADSFDALRVNIPRIVKDKKSGDQVRVWVAGCATGEEAYSVAMMLHEYVAQLDSPPSILVFATDISEDAIQTAREGRYPESIQADVTPERLRRFFVLDEGCYRVRKELRDSVMFASHNLLKDSPFSRLDLVTCRNLLIYLNREAQQRVYGTFHFALRPEGVLFLGTSESADDADSLFDPFDKRHRLFTRRALARPLLPQLPVLLPRPTPLPSAALHSLKNLQSSTQTAGNEAKGADLPVNAQRGNGSFGELHLRLLERYAPPSIVVNENYDIMHMSESAGRFLQFAGGEPTNDLLQVVHPALRIELRTALLCAAQNEQDFRVERIAVPMGDVTRHINLQVRPVPNSDATARGLFLILLEDMGEVRDAPATLLSIEPIARKLEEEVQHLKGQLRSTVEQYEAANEELKASNEELQAMNEEARSTAEELESGKEELQSVNEELQSVNQELKSNVEELSNANSDLQNLMSSTNIATIFLDRNFHIKRYTPSALEVFNIIPTDVDRPLTHITHNLEYPGMAEDAKRVLATLATIEHEVSSNDGKWFIVRLLPYRTTEDRISGVVMTLLDITRRKQEEARHRAQQLAQQTRLFDITLTAINDFAYIFDRRGRFCYANQPLLDLLGVSAEEIVDKNFFDLNYPHDLATRLQQQIEQVFVTGEIVRDETPFSDPDNASSYYEYIFTPVCATDGSNVVEMVAGLTRDVTEHKKSEMALYQSRERLDMALEAGNIFSWEADPTTGRFEWSSNMQRVIGFQLPGSLHEAFELLYPEDRKSMRDAFDAAITSRKPYEAEFRMVNPANGEVFWFRSQGMATESADRSSTRINGITRNITKAKRAQLNAVLLDHISNELMRFNSSQEILQSVSAKIVEHFEVSRCLFVEINEKSGEAVVTHDWHQPHQNSLLGTYQISDFVSEEYLRAVRVGEAFMVSDARHDPRVNMEQLRVLDLLSYLGVPLMTEEHRRFEMALHSNKTREWRDDEVALARELAIRIWGSIERARATEALQASQQRLQRALEIETVGVIFFDMQGKFTNANKAFTRMTGRSHEELASRTLHWLDFTPPEWVPRSEQAFAELLANGRTTPYEKEYLRKDGSRFWGLFAATKINENEIVEYVLDISEHKSAEQRVLESEEQFRIAVEAADLGTWDWNLRDGTVRWNEKHYLLFGLEPDSKLQTLETFERFVHPDDLVRVHENIESAMAACGVFEAEFRAVLQDGTQRWITGYGRVVEQENGRATRMSGVMFDSTEQRHAKEALQRAHDELEERVAQRTQQLTEHAAALQAQAALLDLAHDAILVRDRHQNIIYWSNGAVEQYGWTPAEAMGRNVHELLSTRFPIPLEEIEASAEEKGRWDGELFHTCKDGRVITVQSRWAIQRKGNGEVVNTLEINSDITARKEAEAQRRDLLRRIVNTQEEERRRISRELHDQFGQSLTALMLGLKSLPDMPDAGFSPPSGNQRIEQLQEITKELTNQVHQLAWELRPALLDNIGLEAALRQWVQEWSKRTNIEAHFHSRGLRAFQKDLRLPPIVETTLFRVVQEALNNVLRHSQATQVGVLIEYSQERVVLTIEDNGIGFEMKDGEPTAVGRLGLVGMRERIDLVNGEINIESSPGQGTLLLVRVPTLLISSYPMLPQGKPM